MVSYTRNDWAEYTANPSAQGVINRIWFDPIHEYREDCALGVGQMGNGIAQVAACAGYQVTMIDIKQEFVDKGIATIEKSLSKLVSKERMSQVDADAAVLEFQVPPIALQLLMQIWSLRPFLKFQISNSQPSLNSIRFAKKAPFSPVTQVVSVSMKLLHPQIVPIE